MLRFVLLTASIFCLTAPNAAAQVRAQYGGCCTAINPTIGSQALTTVVVTDQIAVLPGPANTVGFWPGTTVANPSAGGFYHSGSHGAVGVFGRDGWLMGGGYRHAQQSLRALGNVGRRGTRYGSAFAYQRPGFDGYAVGGFSDSQPAVWLQPSTFLASPAISAVTVPIEPSRAVISEESVAGGSAVRGNVAVLPTQALPQTGNICGAIERTEAAVPAPIPEDEVQLPTERTQRKDPLVVAALPSKPWSILPTDPGYVGGGILASSSGGSSSGGAGGGSSGGGGLGGIDVAQGQTGIGSFGESSDVGAGGVGGFGSGFGFPPEEEEEEDDDEDEDDDEEEDEDSDDQNEDPGTETGGSDVDSLIPRLPEDDTSLESVALLDETVNADLTGSPELPGIDVPVENPTLKAATVNEPVGAPAKPGTTPDTPVVPEPTSILLLVIGLGAGGWYFWRQRAKSLADTPGITI